MSGSESIDRLAARTDPRLSETANNAPALDRRMCSVGLGCVLSLGIVALLLVSGSPRKLPSYDHGES